MSSLRPVIFSIRRMAGRAVPGNNRVRSRVRYLSTGNASLVSVVNTSSPCSPSGTGSPVTGSTTSGQEVVLPEVRSVLPPDALDSDPGPHDLAESVDVDRVQVESPFEPFSHLVRPWFGAEDGNPSVRRPRIDAYVLERVSEREQVCRRTQHHLGCEVLDHLGLPTRSARRMPARRSRRAPRSRRVHRALR